MTSPPNRPWPDDVTIAQLADRAAALRGGDRYATMHAAYRLLQDRIAGSVLPDDAADQVTAALQALTATLEHYQAPESERQDGWRPDLPGRGHPLLPPYLIDSETDVHIRGSVIFTRYYLGGNGAAHGGAIPLLFDDVLGKVVNYHHAEGVARTASLTVNYRRIVPLDHELHFDATVDKVDGRKRWGSARLTDETGTLLADAEGLFLRLRPGQQ